MLIIGALLCFCSESDKGSSQGVEVIELSDTANAPHCQAHSKMNVDWKVLLYSFPMPASMILDHLIGLPLHQSFSCGLGAAGQQTQLIFGSLDTLVLWEHQLFRVFPFIESLSRQPVVVAVNLVKSVRSVTNCEIWQWEKVESELTITVGWPDEMLVVFSTDKFGL